jgi:hypothetical protein
MRVAHSESPPIEPALRTAPFVVSEQPCDPELITTGVRMVCAPDPKATMSSPENIDRLRAEIDSGRTGDKVPAADPALAPLGTDEEAAGTPAAPETIARARQQETARPHEARPRRGPGHAWVLIAFAALLAGAFIAWGLVGRP